MPLRTLLIAVTLTALLLGCNENRELPAPSASGRPHIILIVADTLRADHLGAYGYSRDTSPTLDAMASESLLFFNAISPAPWTSPSIASLFTSVYPTAHGVAIHSTPGDEASAASILPEKFVTLAESLRAEGYATLGVTANPWVHPDLGFAQGFDALVPLEQPHGSYTHAREVNETALELLAAHGSERPFFLYLHYMDPHEPYRIPESERHGLRKLSVAGALGEHPKKVRRKVKRYDRAIFSLDRELGKLIDRLRGAGLWDGAIVAFVGDHGQQFLERGFIGHGHGLHAEETRVPMWIRAEGLQGVRDGVSSSLDLFPTLLALAGLPVPEGLQGVDLSEAHGSHRRQMEGALSEAVYQARGPNRRALTSAQGLRLLLEFAGDPRDSPPRHRSVVGVFDLEADPGEKSPIAGHPQEAALIDDFYQLYDASRAMRVEPRATSIDGETADRLRALGYLE